ALCDAERFVERCVELGQTRLGHLSNVDVEVRGLAAQGFCAVVIGKLRVELGAPTWQRAAYTAIERIDHLPRADDERDVVPGAAFEHLAVDTSREVDLHPVALLRRANDRLEGATLAAEVLRHSIDVFFGSRSPR